MDTITAPAPAPAPVVARGKREANRRGAFGILFAPVTLLIVLFLFPLLVMVEMSIVKFPPNTSSGFTLQHYADVLTDHLNLHIAWTTMFIGTTAMVIMLVIAYPARLLHGVQGGEARSCSSCCPWCSQTSWRRW